MKWDEIEHGKGFARQDQKHLLLVQRVGSSWGYTIWRHARCIAGACDWNWSVFDAQSRADEVLSEMMRMAP